MRIVFILLFFSSSVYSENIEKETDPSKFYEEFRALVIENKRQAVAKVFRYPVSVENLVIHSQESLLENYDKVFTSGMLELLKCSSQPDIVEHGTRGTMVNRGAIWLGRFYFGEIIPDINKSSLAEYVDQIEAQLKDKQNWFVRVYSVIPKVASCETAP